MRSLSDDFHHDALARDRGADRAAAIERRIDACARISEAESVCRWNGAIEIAREFVVEIKTTEARRHEVACANRAFNVYDLPEIRAHPIVGGSQAYVDWLAAEVAPG